MAESDYFILTFDGGGMRGLISALLVQQLEEELKFLERVNLFAGTSTGGLLALGLASGVHVDTLVDIYMRRGGEVFKEYVSLTAVPPREVTDTYQEAELLRLGLFHVKYTDEGLKKLIEETFPAKKTLGELKRQVLVTAFDLYQEELQVWEPISLTNLPGSTTDDILVLDAALSTTAGPVYFPPHVFNHKGEQKALIDGGVYANNPSMLAAASVMASLTLKQRDIRLLSLGTGFTHHSIPPRNLRPLNSYGVWEWMLPKPNRPTPKYPLLEILMDGVSNTNTFQCRQIFGTNFRRGNVHIQPTNPDDHRPATVSELKRLTDAYMDSQEWTDIKHWIRRGFV